MNTSIGGDRLGSGNKQNVSFKNYERSTHDLSYLWRSSMAAGTLVPFMSEVGLPGDSFEIDLSCEVLTLPTVGPLFGSYKVQLDVFSVPIRLYNGNLHMNLLGVGMDMKSITLPQMLLRADKTVKNSYDDNAQVNSSSIFSYLNIRGLGRPGADISLYLERSFNAVPYLAYWDIYKQYYANKQEEEGVVIHRTTSSASYQILNADMRYNNGPWLNVLDEGVVTYANQNNDFKIELYGGAGIPNWDELMITIGTNPPVKLAENSVSITVISDTVRLFEGWKSTAPHFGANASIKVAQQTITAEGNTNPDQSPKLFRFPLSNIDDMRKFILTRLNDAVVYTNLFDYPPYNLAYRVSTVTDGYDFAQTYTQEGLAIKTYQSDLFNNWISTEWIDGTNGINEITSVSTVGDSFTIDALNLASKVYAMLNRIAISGGSYDDWLDAVYTHERSRGVENPVYHGSLIRELSFQEVVSTAQTAEQPLGNLAGRGKLTEKTKGGKINISCDEPCYIMGIVSITPRVDYSQGNKWDVN